MHPRLKVLEAYKRALTTWARWVDKNIDRNRTMVLFRGYSVTHFRYSIFSSHSSISFTTLVDKLCLDLLNLCSIGYAKLSSDGSCMDILLPHVNNWLYVVS